jgi:uncharacterized BrkB/YihY/UPF0761 family membrane protein
MGKYYVFHDWKNLKNSWDNKEKINKWWKEHIWDNIVTILCIFILIYFILIYVFGMNLPLPEPFYDVNKTKTEKIKKVNNEPNKSIRTK